MKFKVCDLSKDEVKNQITKSLRPVWYVILGFFLFLFGLQLLGANGAFNSMMLLGPLILALYIFGLYVLTIKTATTRFTETEIEKLSDSFVISERLKSQTISISKLRNVRIQQSPVIINIENAKMREQFVQVSAVANRVFINSNSTKLLRVLPISQLESFLNDLNLSIPVEYISQYGFKTSKETFYNGLGRKE